MSVERRGRNLGRSPRILPYSKRSGRKETNRRGWRTALRNKGNLQSMAFRNPLQFVFHRGGNNVNVWICSEMLTQVFKDKSNVNCWLIEKIPKPIYLYYYVYFLIFFFYLFLSFFCLQCRLSCEPKLPLASWTKCKLNYARFTCLPLVHETGRILTSIYTARKKLMSIFKFLVWSLNWLCDKELRGACQTTFRVL